MSLLWEQVDYTAPSEAENRPEHTVNLRSSKTVETCQHWIFDMDGTLTNAIHDFDDIRKQLNLPVGKPILESISLLPETEQARVSKQLDDLEMDIAANATQQPGAQILLETLQAQGKKIGILTRNGKEIARATLEACGLHHLFDDACVISRDCCTPKPDPAGVQLLLNTWNAAALSTVMVGDYLFDLEAGQNAGTHTVHLAVDGQFHWPEKTTLGVSSLDELTALL